MRVPLSWLGEFAPFADAAKDPKQLAETLDDLGLVVEELVKVGEGIEDVVVARVLEIAAIPGADRIRRVVVDAGGAGARSANPVEVVCGAWNFSVGDLVPLAPVGAVLPGDFTITRRKMKGVVSNGMLCSGAELGLGEDASGIMVLSPRPDPSAAPIEPGMALAEALGIERDVVFDIAVEANRPDAWSIAGVARDLAAKLRLPFSIPQTPLEVIEGLTGGEQVDSLATLEVVDLDLCPRFTLRVITGVRVGPSGPLVARRLTLAGMRPINNVVDASNYVMLELGQPTHPYDLDQVAGHGLRVRAARQGEKLVTLDGVERTLGGRSAGHGDDRRDCVICDALDRPIGIGGIMGGEDSEISPSTTRVLLEAAWFTPMAIARSAKRLGLRTEASARFERGCDPWGIDRGADRFVEILSVTAGADMCLAPGVLDVRGDIPGPRRVEVRTDRVNLVLGTEGHDRIDDATLAGHLRRIGFGCEVIAPGRSEVTVPTFRPDTTREIDVIEEIARHHGYSKLPRRRPVAPQVGALSAYQRQRRAVREAMAGIGAYEVWTPSLLGPDAHQRAGLGPGGVKVTNPLSPEESVLRRSMLPGMLEAWAFNVGRRQGAVRFFEIGHVFPPPSPQRVSAAFERSAASVIDEQELLCVLLAGPGDDARSAVGAWQVLAGAMSLCDVELVAHLEGAPGTGGGLHPTRRAQLIHRHRGQELALGWVGEVDPEVLGAFGLDPKRQRVGWLEVNLVLALGQAAHPVRRARALSRFPSSDFDLAFVVDEEVPASALVDVLREASGELLESLALFDVYRGPAIGEGQRGLTFRIRLCALDHTLTDAEIEAVRKRCIKAVESKTPARLRT